MSFPPQPEDYAKNQRREDWHDERENEKAQTNKQ
jgi:hypothetical protein